MPVIDLSVRKTTASNDKTLEEMIKNLQSLVGQLQKLSDANNVSDELRSHIGALIKSARLPCLLRLTLPVISVIFTRYSTLLSNLNDLAYRKLRFAKRLRRTLKTVPRIFAML